MQIKKLTLHNFRNFSDQKFVFKDRNLIYGKNGTGKTNLLEAIHLLCTGKSFRQLSNLELLRQGTGESYLFADFTSRGRKLNAGLRLKHEKNFEEPKKELFVNNKKISAVKLFGQFPVVLFAPEELKLVWGPPKERRAILDLLITQLEPNYALRLYAFGKVLKQRNKLLYLISLGHASPSELGFWDKEFIENAAQIVMLRTKTTASINQFLAKQYQAISQTQEILRLEILSSLGEDFHADALVETKEFFSRKLKESLPLDIHRGSTSFGPHRDEPKLFLDAKSLAEFGSRGEGRSAVLALKFVQKELFEKQSPGSSCIFLFDDAFSELDQSRVKYLLDHVGKEQGFFTATDIPEKLANANLIELK